MTTRIHVSSGAKKYVGGTIRETEGKDISGASFVVGLSSSWSVPPATWVAPSINTAGASTAERVLKLLVDNTTPLGDYVCWARITDTPEVEPIVLMQGISVE